MKRDESKDVFVLTEDGEPMMNEMCISTQKGSLLDEVIDESQEETRYVPFSQLETEREVSRDVKREAAEIIAGLEDRLVALQDAARNVWLVNCNRHHRPLYAMSEALEEMESLLP